MGQRFASFINKIKCKINVETLNPIIDDDICENVFKNDSDGAGD